MLSSNRANIFALGGLIFFSFTYYLKFYSKTNDDFCTPSALPLTPLHAPKHTQQEQRKLHLLLPINSGAAMQSQARFCKTVLSALINGYEPTVINWDVGEASGYELQIKKITGVHEYLMNITDKSAENDLVLMVDTLDVWFQLSPRTLVQRFEELGTSRVMIGAETACWPNPEDSIACQDAPNSTLPKGAYNGYGQEPRWANSGTIIGSIAAMRPIFKDLADGVKGPDRKHEIDQAYFNDYLSLRRITADYRSRLFWSTAQTDLDRIPHFINTPYHIDDLIPHELYPSLLHIAPTGEIPVLMHMNGLGKHLIEEWWGTLWWNKLQDEKFSAIVASRVKRSVLRFAGGELKPWRDICPKEVLPGPF